MTKPTVANLILALQKLPQDAIIEARDDTGQYTAVDLDYLPVLDFTGDNHKSSTLYGKIFIEL